MALTSIGSSVTCPRLMSPGSPKGSSSHKRKILRTSTSKSLNDSKPTAVRITLLAAVVIGVVSVGRLVSRPFFETSRNLPHDALSNFSQTLYLYSSSLIKMQHANLISSAGDLRGFFNGKRKYDGRHGGAGPVDRFPDWCCPYAFGSFSERARFLMDEYLTTSAIEDNTISTALTTDGVGRFPSIMLSVRSGSMRSRPIE